VTYFSSEGAATNTSDRALFEQRAAVARNETKRARLALEAAERSQAFWEVLVGHLVKGHPASILLHLDRHRDYLRSLETGHDPAFQHLVSLRKEAYSSVRSAAEALGRTFPEAARSAGLVIDSSSRHPRYTFRNGFLRLEFDEKRLVAKLQTREGEEKEYGLDLDLIVGVVRDEMSRLFERDFKPELFLRRLHTAYSAVLRAEDLAEGTEVPIRRVTHRLGKNLNRFSTDEFNVDLAQAIQSGHTTVDGRQLHLNHTRNTRQGMLLHGLEQGGYVGFISFKGEDPR
jgi:hypothetical protein